MRTSRFARALPAGLLAVALLAACGDETAEDPEAAGDGPGTAPTLTSRTLGGDPLDISEATTALLAQANVPELFVDMGPSTPEEIVDDGKSGCESDVSFEDRFDRGGLASTRTDTAFLFGDESRLLIITSLVTSFGDDGLAESAYDAVIDDFASCTRYEEVDESGGTTVVDIENNTDAATDDVDDQLNMLGVGLWTGEGFADLQTGFGLSLARVDNNVTLTQVISLGVADDRLLLAPYTEIAVNRLVAVMNGETPEEVAGPTPTVVPSSRLPLPATPATYESYFELDPRFSLPD